MKREFIAPGNWTLRRDKDVALALRSLMLSRVCMTWFEVVQLTGPRPASGPSPLTSIFAADSRGRRLRVAALPVLDGEQLLLAGLSLLVSKPWY